MRILVCRRHQTVCFWPAISQADKFISNEPIFQAGNLNAEDDFESEYLRYGGTVGVRNPRLVAAMRGVPPYQQHIQMNMMNRFWLRFLCEQGEHKQIHNGELV